MRKTMGRIAIVATVAVAALVLCAPAFAWPVDLDWWHPDKDFTCAGKAKAVDTVNGKLVVRVQLASVGVAQYLAEDLTITVTPDTQVLLHKGIGFKAIDLGDIAIDDHARVVGIIDRSGVGRPNYVAQRIVVRHPVPAEGLTRFACRGPLVSVDSAAGSVVVHLHLVTRALWDQLGTDFTLKVAGDATVFTVKDGAVTPITLADIVAGQRLSAQGVIDRTDADNPVFTIKWLRILPVAAPVPVPGAALSTR